MADIEPKNESENVSKTFKQYYADPAFRAKHLARMSEKIECPCGVLLSRSNTAKHRKTKRHIQVLQTIAKVLKDK